MGGSNGGGGDPTGNMMTNRDIQKAKSDRNRREMAQSGVQDPYEFTRLAENLQAQKLEREAQAASITGNKLLDAAVPGAGALSLVTQFSKEQQARELRRGGEMVTDDKGNYQGVVSKNFLGGRVFSGNPDFDPIGGGTSGSDDNPPPVQRVDVTPEVTPEITPEIIPDEQETILTRTRGTRRTKRAGQAGTFIEGYGALQRGKGERSVV